MAENGWWWWYRSIIQPNKTLKVLNQGVRLFLAWGPKSKMLGDSSLTATEEHISPLSWPSCLCFAPEFSPNARLLLRPASPARPDP